jgi:L-ascorbate metabolism protein UlaG (beta-lactamase superfamily)
MSYAGTMLAVEDEASSNAATVQVDGRTMVFPDAKPYVEPTGVYVPVRIVAENMGIPVYWDAVSQMVRIGDGGSAVSFKPANANSGNQPFLNNGRVYVDLNFVRNKLEVETAWNRETMTASMAPKSNVLKGVQLFKQSMVKLAGVKTIYIDPYKVDGEPKDGDIIFITHTHGDHFSLADMHKVAKEGAIVVFPHKETDKVKDAGFGDVVGAVPGEEGTVEGISYEAVPSYNTQKTNHTKDRDWVGYIIAVNGHTYYIAGDTDLIPEMKDFDADVAFLPIGGTYTMEYKEAAQAANVIHPRVVVPYHYQDVVGTREDAIHFIDLIEPGIVAILMKE